MLFYKIDIYSKVHKITSKLKLLMTFKIISN